MCVWLLWIWNNKLIIRYNREQLDDNVQYGTRWDYWIKFQILVLLFKTEINLERSNGHKILSAFSALKIWSYLRNVFLWSVEFVENSYSSILILTERLHLRALQSFLSMFFRWHSMLPLVCPPLPPYPPPSWSFWDDSFFSLHPCTDESLCPQSACACQTYNL